MALWLAALLGLVQGLTEYIPVSSTAHLYIVNLLVGEKDAGAEYTAVIQLGTLLAVLAYFAKDLVALTAAMVKDPGSPEGRLPWLLALGTVPIVVLGLVMAFVDQHAQGREVFRPFASITYMDALIVGLAQTLALVPGVSRSGATICMALLLGFSRSDSARFSFLLSIPAVAGAGILEARTACKVLGADAIPALAVGTGVAAITGYISIAWLMRWLGSHQLIGFAIYRIVAGLALLGALAARVIQP